MNGKRFLNKYNFIGLDGERLVGEKRVIAGLTIWNKFKNFPEFKEDFRSAYNEARFTFQFDDHNLAYIPSDLIPQH